METEAKPKEAEPLGEDAAKGEIEASSHTDAGNATTQDSSISNGDDADDKQEKVDLKIIWNKNKYDLKIPVDSTGAKLKESIHSLTGKRTQQLTFSSLLYLLFRAIWNLKERKKTNVYFCLARSSTGNAESDVQRIASRGQDAT